MEIESPWRLSRRDLKDSDNIGNSTYDICGAKLSTRRRARLIRQHRKIPTVEKEASPVHNSNSSS